MAGDFFLPWLILGIACLLEAQSRDRAWRCTSRWGQKAMGFVTDRERAAETISAYATRPLIPVANQTQAAIASGSCTHYFHCIAAGLEACGVGAQVLYRSGWRDVRWYSAFSSVGSKPLCFTAQISHS